MPYMNTPDENDKKVRRIAAVIYLLVIAFLVGGTLIHQRSLEKDPPETSGFSELKQF